VDENYKINFNAKYKESNDNWVINKAKLSFEHEYTEYRRFPTIIFEMTENFSVLIRTKEEWKPKQVSIITNESGWVYYKLNRVNILILKLKKI
jgi:hypothetical protein